MKIHPLDKELYAKTLARLTESTRPLGQKHVDYMKKSLDEHFAFRATLDASEIDGERLRLKWQSKLRLWFSRTLKHFRAGQYIKRINSFKFDA